jgi:predicted O-methyltransferase YrrM
MVRVTTAARLLKRHFGDVGQVTASMLLPTKTGLELAARGRTTKADVHLPVPSVFLADLFPGEARESAVTVKMMAGTALNGAPNVLDQFILSALVKRVQPQVILEVGTFKGSTTWLLLENAPSDAVIYTIDLPDDEIPVTVSDIRLASIKARPFLPTSGRVRQILANTMKWDGTLDPRAASQPKVQFAFIDADHRYEGVRSDTEKVLPLLDESACVCWHDVIVSGFDYGVGRYLTELVREGWKIFRLRSIDEVSGLAIWMSDSLLAQLKVPAPRREGTLLSRWYSGVDWYRQ